MRRTGHDDGGGAARNRAMYFKCLCVLLLGTGIIGSDSRSGCGLRMHSNYNGNRCRWRNRDRRRGLAILRRNACDFSGHQLVGRTKVICVALLLGFVLSVLGMAGGSVIFKPDSAHGRIPFKPQCKGLAEQLATGYNQLRKPTFDQYLRMQRLIEKCNASNG